MACWSCGCVSASYALVDLLQALSAVIMTCQRPSVRLMSARMYTECEAVVALAASGSSVFSTASGPGERLEGSVVPDVELQCVISTTTLSNV